MRKGTAATMAFQSPKSLVSSMSRRRCPPVFAVQKRLRTKVAHACFAAKSGKGVSRNRNTRFCFAFSVFTSIASLRAISLIRNVRATATAIRISKSVRAVVFFKTLDLKISLKCATISFGLTPLWEDFHFIKYRLIESFVRIKCCPIRRYFITIPLTFLYLLLFKPFNTNRK